MLAPKGLWQERDLYCATPTVTRDLTFSAIIWMTVPFSHLLDQKWMWRAYSNTDLQWYPFSHLLRHTRGYGGPILTWILTYNIRQNICLMEGSTAKIIVRIYLPINLWRWHWRNPCNINEYIKNFCHIKSLQSAVHWYIILNFVMSIPFTRYLALQYQIVKSLFLTWQKQWDTRTQLVRTYRSKS
jgi:hypothetical protein